MLNTIEQIERKITELVNGYVDAPSTVISLTLYPYIDKYLDKISFKTGSSQRSPF